MKVSKEKLYDAFGELIYAVAKADGSIQDEELVKLHEILNGHPWAKEIKWSFEYENKKDHSVELAFKMAVDICKENGPDPEYKYLIEVLNEVAKSSNGIDANEEKIIQGFIQELQDRFLKDFEEK